MIGQVWMFLLSDPYPEPTAQWRVDRSAYAISIQRHGPGDKMRECSLTNQSLPGLIAVKFWRRSRVAIFVYKPLLVFRTSTKY